MFAEMKIEQENLQLSETGIEFFLTRGSEKGQCTAAVHLHNAIEFLYITRGAFLVYVNGEKYTAQAIDAALQQNLERSLEYARYDVAQNTDRQRGIAADSRTEAVGNREYVAESSVGAVERTMRGIAEGVFRRTSDGRAAMARQAAAEQRAAEEAARRAEQERKRELEQLEQEHREIEKRQRKSLTHDFGPTL